MAQSSMKNGVYDLEERLLDYAARIIRLVEHLPDNRSSNHVSGQLLRCGTSPLPNHGEAQGAESRADFVHKMSLCYKELRESRRWLRLILRVPLVSDAEAVQGLITETEELIRIFAASLKTARGGLPVKHSVDDAHLQTQKRTFNVQRTTFNVQRERPRR